MNDRLISAQARPLRLELCFLSCRLPTVLLLPLIFVAMPTYEYSCAKCDQTFEASQSMRDQPFRECPKELCRLPRWGHGKVKRLFGTGAGLIFKGSGFYATDYRSNSYKEAAKKDSTSTAGVSAEKSTVAAETASKTSAAASTKTSQPKKEPTA
jgi:putative FmdB family regulatory protein